MKKIQRVLKAFGFIVASLLFIILIFNVTCIIKGKITGEQCPTVFRLGTAVVATGSMEPNIHGFDLVVIIQTDDFALNDVAVYSGSTYCVTHRVIDITEDENGNRVFTMKGDANNTSEIVPSDKMIGKVVMRIPYVGYIRAFFTTPLGIILLISFVAVMLFVLPRISEWKKRSSEKRKQKGQEN